MPDTDARARDVRAGESWSAGQRLKNALIYAAIRIALAIADRLPESVLLAVLGWIGRLLYVVLGRESSLARAHLAQAFAGPRADELAQRCFVTAGQNLGRVLLLRRKSWRIAARVSIDASAKRLLLEAIAEGRGLIFVSAHLGPFEWLAAAIAELGMRPAVVVRESYDPRLDPIVDRHRIARGIEVIHRGSESAPFRILSALRAGRVVGFLPDLPGHTPTLPAHFLGQHQLARGPQRLAQRLSAPLIAGTLEANGRHFDMRLTRIRGRNEQELTQGVANALSASILRNPEHWLWMAARLSPSLTMSDEATHAHPRASHGLHQAR